MDMGRTLGRHLADIQWTGADRERTRGGHEANTKMTRDKNQADRERKAGHRADMGRPWGGPAAGRGRKDGGHGAATALHCTTVLYSTYCSGL